jgi:integrase
MDLETQPLLEEYFTSCTERKLAAATVANYHWVLDDFGKHFPTLPDDQQEVIQYILSKGGAPQTMRDRLKPIRTFYRWVGEVKRVAIPSLSAKRLPKHTAVPRAYSQDEIHRILHAARTPTERAIVILLAQAAPRRGGVCTLRAENMRDHVALVKEKTGSRVLYLPDEAWQAVQFAVLGKGFLSNTKQPMGPKDLERLTRRLLKDAGVYERGSGDHGFRHAFKAQFEVNGGTELQSKKLMGHSPSNMSEHYYHLANAEAVAVANKFAPRGFLQCPLDCALRQAEAV